MKKYILYFLILLVISAISVGVYKFNKKTEKGISEKENFKVEAVSFLKEYSENKDLADKKYLNKTVLVNGKIKSYSGISNGINLELSAGNEMETVTCSIDSSQIDNKVNFDSGREVNIKGRCGGYTSEEMLGLKNIGLVQCSIVN